MKALKTIWLLALKDLRIEYRTRQSFLTTLFFGVLILIIFNFAFDPGSQSIKDAVPGILWVSLLFPGIIQLNRSFQAERENGTFYGLILSPVDRGLIFFGKFTANWIFLFLLDLMILLAFIIFYNISISTQLLWIVVLLVLVGLVYASVGTLFAAMISDIRARDVLLPILLFPILVPVVIAAVNSTRELLVLNQLDFFYTWLRLLVVSDVIFVAGSFLVFDFIVGD
jgi:heme exporter protein B